MKTPLRLFVEKTLQILVLLTFLIATPYIAIAQLTGTFNDVTKVIAKNGDDVAIGTSRGTARAANIPYVAPQRVKLSFTPSPTVTRRPSSAGRVIDNSSNASFDRATPDPQATRRVVRQSTSTRNHTTDATAAFERKRVDYAITPRAARREAMRQDNIPTSQQPKSQSQNASGREYTYEVPKVKTVAGGDRNELKSVQQQTLDRSHANKPHWESGSVKTDPLTGEIRTNKYGRPKLVNDKSKVGYDHQ